MENNNRPPHTHILKVSFVPYTHTKPSRIKITSERFKKSFFIPFHDSVFSNTLDIAVEYLKMQGFDITGFMEGLKCYYIATTTFALKKEKFVCSFTGRKGNSTNIICSDTLIYALTINKAIEELYKHFEYITDLFINGHKINSPYIKPDANKIDISKPDGWDKNEYEA